MAAFHQRCYVDRRNMKNMFTRIGKVEIIIKRDDVWISISPHTEHGFTEMNSNSIYGEWKKGYWKKKNHHQFIANEIWIFW